ncbi:unnamed protein product [Penicillium salamii]|nr:unnamed protein product [Penicillium salamii]
MRKIYAQAGRVIVWLGDDREDGESALRWINHLAGQQDQSLETSFEDDRSSASSMGLEGWGKTSYPDDLTTEDPASDDQSTRYSSEDEQSMGYPVEGDHSKKDSMTEREVACSKLLQRDWFRRVWVLQEVGVARYIDVLCGSTQISAYAFAEGLGGLDLPQSLLAEVGPVTYLMKSASFRPKFDVASSGQHSLGELLGMYRNHQATEQNDKIYALLGLSADTGAVDLQPNYTTPWHQVFREITSHIFPGCSVQTWKDRASAVVKTKGWIIGHVGHVKSDIRDYGQQILTCHLHGTARAFKVSWPSAWRLFACAELVQEGDIICCLQGQSRPSVLRLCNDHLSLLSPSLWLRGKSHTQGLNDALEQGQLRHGHDITLTWTIPMNGSVTKPKDSLELKNITPEFEDSQSEADLRREFMSLVMLDIATQILESKVTQSKAWENILKQCGHDVSMSEIYKLATRVITPDRISGNRLKGSPYFDFIDLLLKYRGESAPDVEMAKWACQDYNNPEFLGLLFKHRGERLPITEEVLKVAAQNSSVVNVKALLEHRRENIQVSEEVLKVAARNPGKYYAPGILEILLQHGGESLLISEEMVKLAIETPGRHCREIVQILLQHGGKDLSISEEIVRLAVGESSGNPKGILEVLLQHGVEDLSISDEMIITAAGNSQGCAVNVLKILFQHGGKDLSIPEEAVKAAAGCARFPRDTLELLFQYKENIPVSEGVVEAAAGNPGNEAALALKVLFQHREGLLVSEEAVKAAAGNTGTCAPYLLEILFQHRENLPISEEMVKVAAGNPGNRPHEALKILFQHRENLSISEEVVKAAAGNCGHYSPEVLKVLFQHRENIPISEEVVKAAVGNPGYYSHEALKVLFQHRENLSISKEMVKAAAGNPRNRPHEALKVLF